MDVTRRGFLSALIGGLTLDPERALWVPGRKLISIPQPRLVSMTAQHIIEAAMRSLSIIHVGETASREYQEDALFRLNAMLDSWNVTTLQQRQVDSAIYGFAYRLAPVYGVRNPYAY